jgi:propionyl-CoA carboxylase alpha chain
MIYISEGKPLEIRQEDVQMAGHAVEVRVYAEDPANAFLPDVGCLSTYVRPQGSGVRVDDGFEQGMEVPIYYDPMIAKLITYGQDRDEAIAKMVRAIDEYQITGVQTTLPFARFVMNHPAFRSGEFDTHFVSKYFSPEMLSTQDEESAAQLAAFLTAHLWSTKASKNTEATMGSTTASAWKKNRLR